MLTGTEGWVCSRVAEGALLMVGASVALGLGVVRSSSVARSPGSSCVEFGGRLGGSEIGVAVEDSRFALLWREVSAGCARRGVAGQRAVAGGPLQVTCP